MSRIHLADAGTAGVCCHLPLALVNQNWTYKPEQVTCKRCLKIYRERVEAAQRRREEQR